MEIKFNSEIDESTCFCGGPVYGSHIELTDASYSIYHINSNIICTKVALFPSCDKLKLF